MAVGLLLVAALALLGARFRYALNPDGIAYLGLAGDLAGHPWGALDAGVWGTLFPRLIALATGLGLAPTDAARGVIAASALLFWWGGSRVLGAFVSGEGRRLAGSVVLALFAAVWSVAFVTPDLLLAAFLLLGIAPWVRSGPPTPSVAVGSGVWLALAALTKPMGVVVGTTWVVALVVLRLRGGAPRRAALVPALVALAVPLLIGVPRVVTLLDDYAGFNSGVSADGVYDHAIFNRFHVPEPGLITSWERLSAEVAPGFSPPPGERIRIQAALSWESATDSLMALLDMSWLFALALLAGLAGMATRGGRFGGRWRWALVPPLLLLVLHAPFPSERRYLWAALPLVMAAVWGMADAWSARRGTRPRWLDAVVVLSFLVAGAPGALAILRNHGVAGAEAHALAEGVREAGAGGPVAGLAARPGGYAGLYTAYYLGQPWYGDVREAGPAEVRGSGAALYVLPRASDRAAGFDDAPGFTRVAEAGGIVAYRVEP